MLHAADIGVQHKRTSPGEIPLGLFDFDVEQFRLAKLLQNLGGVGDDLIGLLIG
jgi:hypothetical protein